ncbi:MAG: hypothetical protein HY000_31295, partial [Planctomycetes bacterium]|nr:hypothetical protein [Planctomycetota bacterium]
LPRLERLELTSTSVTGGAILANLPRLKVLMIRKGTLSDADLQEICRLPDVERLELVQTGVTDAGVEHIRNTRIWKLTLQNYLSDAALLHLRNHPTLREIDIHTKNSLTAAAVASLRESLPDCKVIWADSAKPSVSKSAD